MKTLNGIFEVKDLEQLLIECEFDNEDCQEATERAIKNIPLLEATYSEGLGQSMYLTFSEGDRGYCILSFNKDEDIVNDTIDRIESLIEIID